MRALTASGARRPAVGVRGAIALGVLAVAAAVVGWLAGGAGESERTRTPADPSARTVQTGAARVTVSGAWRRTEAPAALRDAGAVAFEPAPGSAATASLLTGPIADATLLPADLRARLVGAPPAPRRATLGGLPAWRYADLSLGGGTTAELIVVPTTKDAVVLACTARATEARATEGCAPGVTAVTPMGARALAPEPDLAARLRLPAAVSALDRVRVSGRRDLRQARRARGQGRAAARLGRGYAAAARRLAPVAAARGDSARLVASFRRAAKAYRALGAAARRIRPAAYGRARGRVARAETAVAAAVGRLR